MHSKTIRTPFLVNLFFHIFLIAPILVGFAIYGVIEANATTYKEYCRTAWEDGFFQKIEPGVQKVCGKKFEFYTRQEIRRFNLKNK